MFPKPQGSLNKSTAWDSIRRFLAVRCVKISISGSEPFCLAMRLRGRNTAETTAKERSDADVAARATARDRVDEFCVLFRIIAVHQCGRDGC